MINEVKKDRISYGDLPNKYEAGTMATAQVIAFDQSIKFLESIGIENIIKHEKELIEYGQEILQKNNSVKLIGNPKDRGGVLSFTIEGVHPHDIATILDEDGQLNGQPLEIISRAQIAEKMGVARKRHARIGSQRRVSPSREKPKQRQASPSHSSRGQPKQRKDPSNINAR